MTHLWRIVREGWTADGNLRSPASGRLYPTRQQAVDQAQSKIFIVAEEPGVGCLPSDWLTLDRPYHVMMRRQRWADGTDELARYDDLDVAEMAMRLLMPR